jgi:hypothetical protein
MVLIAAILAITHNFRYYNSNDKNDKNDNNDNMDNNDNNYNSINFNQPEFALPQQQQQQRQ